MQRMPSHRQADGRVAARSSDGRAGKDKGTSTNTDTPNTQMDQTYQTMAYALRVRVRACVRIFLYSFDV